MEPSSGRLQPHLAVDGLIGWRQSDQTKHTSYLPLYYCARPLQPRTLHPEGVCARERDITSLLPSSHLITCLSQRASLFPDSPPHPLVHRRAPKPRCPLTPDWHASQNTPTPHHRLASFPPCWAESCTVTACSCQLRQLHYAQKADPPVSRYHTPPYPTLLSPITASSQHGSSSSLRATSHPGQQQQHR